MQIPIFLVTFFIFLSSVLKAQDTTLVSRDTVVRQTTPVDTTVAKRRANRAALYSAVLPGAGQFYNKKYWKIPVLYGGITALVLAIDFNNKNYHEFQKAYQARVDADSATVDQYRDIFPDSQSLLVRRDYYRRSRDFMWIISAGVYVLNIIDAYVDAHLADFDVSDDLSLKVAPGLQYTRGGNAALGLALTISR